MRLLQADGDGFAYPNLLRSAIQWLGSPATLKLFAGADRALDLNALRSLEPNPCF